jgi:hypothetical protein
VSQQSVIEARWTPDSKIGSGLAFGRGKVGDGNLHSYEMLRVERDDTKSPTLMIHSETDIKRL